MKGMMIATGHEEIGGEVFGLPAFEFAYNGLGFKFKKLAGT